VGGWMKLADGGWMARQCSISRGWAGEVLPAPTDDELAVEQGPCSTLVLVVHGAGESFWRRRPGRLRGLCESVGKLRSNAATAAARAYKDSARVSEKGATASGGGGSSGEPSGEANGSSESPARRVEFLGVEWSHSIRGSYTKEGEEGGASSLNPTSRLSRVTLSSVPMLREFANEVILDVLFYEQAVHRKRIQSAVVKGISSLIGLWRTHNPSFDADGGRIILLGHSLGALICFDLLSRGALLEPLGGKPSAFFAMGSPLGCFLSLRGATLGRSFVLEHCPRVYNVFHPHDPVAYRLEPLLAETYGEGAEEGEESEEADQGGDARHSHNSEEGAEGDPWMVDENERARQAIDEEDDWSTDQQAMATPRAQVGPTEKQVAGVLPPAVIPYSGISRVESIKQAVTSVSASDVARSFSSWFGFRTVTGEEEEMGDLQEMAAAREADGSERINYALNDGGRVDYALQTSKVELASMYMSALQAHSSYWSHPDVAAFIVQEAIEGLGVATVAKADDAAKAEGATAAAGSGVEDYEVPTSQPAKEDGDGEELGPERISSEKRELAASGTAEGSAGEAADGGGAEANVVDLH